MFLQYRVGDGDGGGRGRVQGELQRAHGLLLQYVAGEEQEGCEDEDCGALAWRVWGHGGGGELADAGGDGDGDLAACEEHGGRKYGGRATI